MEDYRNREWTDAPSVVAQREREEKKQLLKEAFKEALAEDRTERGAGGGGISENFIGILDGRK